MSERVFGTVSRRARSCRDRLDQPPGSSKRHGAVGSAWWSACVSVLVLISWAYVWEAQADESTAAPWLGIETHGDTCIAASTLRQEIERLLEGRRPARVTVRARASGEGWIIELWHANGQRAVRVLPVLPDSCEERLRVLSLTTVLALEHAVDEAPAVVRDEPPRPARQTRWSLGVHAGASVGELPTLAPLLGVEARIERGAWVPVELLALVDLRPAQSSLAGAQLETRQVTGALGTCLGGRRTSWRLDACLGVELGAVLGYAARLPRATRDTAGSGAANLGVVARWSPRPHFAVTIRLEGFSRFWVPRFEVLDAAGGPYAEERLPLVGGRVRFGLSWLSE